ncbi:MAG: 4Fe-4S binding protein [Candidatus Bathyarchaeia archaeon]
MSGSPKFIPKKCTGCGACVNICPTKAIEFIDDCAKKIREIKIWLGACIFCGNCNHFCPEKAIELKDNLIAPSPNKWIFEKLTIRLATCEKCGQVFSPAPLYEKINNLLTLKNYNKLCLRCKQMYYAEIYSKTMA